MKNIHILPTDKEPVKGDLLLRHIWKDTSNECISWWRYDDTITIDGVVQYTTLNGSFRDITSSFKFQNIYITSDEELNQQTKPCWCINTIKNTWNDDLIYYQGAMPKYHFKGFKKIILTTDQDLIKDGVQAIDDEFLEWFIKNPSCEEVEVKFIKDGWCLKEAKEVSFYKIIIPKEEPKQELKIGDTTNFGVITEIKEYSVCFEKNKYGINPWYKKSDVIIIPQEEPKKETLEEAKIKHTKFCIENKIENPSFSFDKGAKWQQEQIGKSEFLQKLRATKSDAEARRLIFEQFKNK